ncbi:type IV pilus twitching motility protein PilT [Thermodesulfobacteriota bacterium]
MKQFDDILREAIKQGASDTHFRVGLRPILRISNTLYPLRDFPRTSAQWLESVAQQLMSDWQRERYDQTHQMDLSYGIGDEGRFRANIFQQKGVTGMVLRFIPSDILSISELQLPKVIEKIAMEMRGMVLVTGTTGSGKSTTLAAMIEHINTHRNCHIITVEDPMEFVFRDRTSIINQREVGVDTDSFAGALRAALRQDPDVIMVGEMRDFETIETAIMAAETGHLVFSTLHTLDAQETINRIISTFPPYHQVQVRKQLAGILRGVISQRLLLTADGKSRVPAVEVLVATGRIAECIEDPDKTKEINDAISIGYTTYGMQTFDQALQKLLQEGKIALDEALKYATNPDDFALKVSGISSGSRFADEIGKPTGGESDEQPEE